MKIQSKTGRSLVSRKLAGAIFAVFALFVQPLVALDVPSAFAAPVVNEVMSNPVTITDTQGQWVEIHNQGTESFDISGWTLNDGGSGSYTFPSSTVLAGDEYYVVCRTMATAEANCDAEWPDMSLLNSGDTVTLENAAAEQQDSFTYIGSNEGQSVEAVREDNTTSSVNNATSSYGTNGNHGTPGAANTAQPTGGVVNETTGEHFTTIQAAINDADTTDGDTILVKSGDYTASNINVSKELTIKGQGSPVLTVPDVTQTNAFDIWADDVTIQGLTIVGPADGTSYKTYAWGGTVTRGVVVHNGAENVIITNNKIRGLRNNVLVDGRNTGSITNNEIDNSKSGVSVQYTDAGTGNTEGYSMTISGNYESDYGNEWGLNTHLNGHYVGGSYHPNVPNSDSEKIAVNAPSAVQTALKQNSAANGGWTVQDQGYRYHNRTAVSVGGTGAADTNQGSPLGPLASVQQGVNAVVDNGTVTVAAGTYSEDVTVSNPLTLHGAQVGVDARTRSASESSVSSFVVTTSNVTIDGFSLTKAGNQINVAPSPATGLVLSGLVFQNNVFNGYTSVGLTTNNAGNLLVQKNLFKDVAGTGEAMQIRANGAFGDAGCSGTKVLDNTFSNASNEGADVNFSCTGSGSTDVEVARNVTSGSTASFTAFSGVSGGINVHDNHATGIQDNSAIYFFGAVTGNVDITDNVVTGGNAYAVSLSSGIYDGSSAHTGTFTITGNDFSNNARGISVSPNALGTGGKVIAHKNNLSGNTTAGVYNSTTTPLDVSANWWGQASGPEMSQYSGDVTVAPWCEQAACTSLFSSQPVQLEATGGEATTDPLTPLTLSNGTVEAVIPAGTTVHSSDSSWDGTIKAPATSSYSVPGSSTTTLAIAVGSDNSSLTFNQPVKLTFPGQKGKHVGFLSAVAGSTFTEITATCNSLTNPTVSDGGACKINDGNDLVVWTKHFTVFATYTILQPTPPVAEGELETEQGSVSPLKEQAALTSAAVTSNSIAKADKGEVLGTDTESAETPVDDAAALAPSEEGWKLWGIAWYWYVLALGAVGAGSWYAVRWYRNRHEEF